MAADGYLKGAISQLEAALVDVKFQIDHLQHDMGNQKQQISHAIESLDRERKVHEVEMARVDDMNQQQVLVSRIRHLGHEANDHKARISQVEADIRQAIDRKNQLCNTLKDLSSQLNSLTASPDLR
jgi:chromosome segregation ATPase